jgi:hypothetical protein
LFGLEALAGVVQQGFFFFASATLSNPVAPGASATLSDQERPVAERSRSEKSLPLRKVKGFWQIFFRRRIFCFGLTQKITSRFFERVLNRKLT